MYIPKYFKAKELVPRHIFLSLGEERSLGLFDDHILRCLDNFREQYCEALMINNDKYNESGFRVQDTTTGAKKSAHKKGIAFDLKAGNMQELRDFISGNAEKLFISRVENFGHTPTWCHIEFSMEPVESTYFFNP